MTTSSRSATQPASTAVPAKSGKSGKAKIGPAVSTDMAPAACVPDGNLGFLMKQVYLSLNRMLDQEMAPLDLTAMQWRPITCLHAKRADTAVGLARLIDVDTGAMTRTLDRLQAKGLVARTRSNEDRRVVRLALTAAGHDIARHIPARISRSLQHHLRGFDDQEVRMLTHFMQRMLANGSVLPPPPSP